VNQTAPNGVPATSRRILVPPGPVGPNLMRIDRRDAENCAGHTPLRNRCAGGTEKRTWFWWSSYGKASSPAAGTRRCGQDSASRRFLFPSYRQQQEIQANGGRPPAISQRPNTRRQRRQPRSNIRMAPPATARYAAKRSWGNNRPGQRQYNEGNRQGQQQRNDQNNSNRPGCSNNKAGQPAEQCAE